MKRAAFLLMILLLPASVFASGVGFSDTYLITGEENRVLLMPAGQFESQIQRIMMQSKNSEASVEKVKKSDRSTYGKKEGPSLWQSTLERDAEDLRTSLRANTSLSSDTIGQRAKEYVAMRKAMKIHADGSEEDKPIDLWEIRPFNPVFNLAPYESLLQSVPTEFSEYVRGAAIYRADEYTSAVLHWDAILQLPKEQRHFRSTWAAYMAGKACLRKEPAKAIPYFIQTRQLAEQGFADSLNLAAESWGWQGACRMDAGAMPSIR